MRSKIAFKNITSNLILQFVIIICGFIIPKLMISNYGSDVYGLVVSITQYLTFISLLEVGIGPVVKSILYKYIAFNDKKKIKLVLKSTSDFFKKIGFVFVLYIIFLIFLFPLINTGYDKFYLISLILICSLSTFFEYFIGMSYNLYLQADKKTYVISTIQIVSYIVNLALSVILIKAGLSIHIVKLVSCLVYLIRPLSYYLYCNKKLKLSLKNVNSNYVIPNKNDGFSQHVAYIIQNNTDVVILTIFTNFVAVAVYSVYNIINTAMRNICTSFLNGMDALFGDMIVKKESNNLKSNFNLYEFVFCTIVTILFSITVVVIIPFVRVYTSGISDADYIYPLFSFLIVFASFLTVVRTLYSTIVYSAGHFKQTNKVTCIEAILNVVISIILVKPLGLVGIAIGTLASTFIRTVYFCYYSSKYIINRKMSIGIKKLIVSIIEFTGIYFIFNNLFKLNEFSYMGWVKYSLLNASLILLIIVIINITLNPNNFKNLIKYLKARKRLKK